MWNKVESRVLTCNLSSFSQNASAASVQKLVHNSISGCLWPFDGKHWKTYENMMLIPLKTLENWGVFWSLRPESTGLSKLQALTDALWLQAIKDSPAKGWGFQSMGVPPNHSFSTFSSVWLPWKAKQSSGTPSHGNPQTLANVANVANVESDQTSQLSPAIATLLELSSSNDHIDPVWTDFSGGRGRGKMDVTGWTGPTESSARYKMCN